MKLTRIKRYFLAMVLICCTPVISFAQEGIQEQQENDKYSSEKLKKFVDASKEISSIQQEGEMKMVQAIEKENLDVETFNKIVELKMDPEQATTEGVTEEQIASFDKVVEELQVIQVQMQQEMESAIREKGIQVEEYQEIIEAYHSDPALQQQINEMFMQ
jgi:hypothetical protein